MFQKYVRIYVETTVGEILKKDLYFFNEFCNAFLLRKNPVYLIHFVTERCNARCPHCFVDFKDKNGELTLEQIERIASTSGKCLRNVALTGGEPFLREDLFEIANIWYKNSTAQTVSITTNGSMPDKIEDFCQKVSKKNIPVFFLFSYDFIGEKHSEYRRLKDLHINVMTSYELVQKFYPNMNAMLQLTVSENNADCAFETYNYMKNELGVKNINCSLVRGENIDKAPDDVRKKVGNVYEKLQSQIDKDFDLKKLNGYTDGSLTSAILNAKNKILWKYVLKDFRERKYFSPCRAGELLGIIYSKGDIFPCEMLNKSFGNLADFDYNFLKCWTSEKAINVKKLIRSHKCHCTYECAWLLNILSNVSYYPNLLYYVIKNNLR